MPFPDSVKDEAKRRAHYKCVICQNPFVEVHHIIQEKDGGPNTLDNAAPLCAGCHDWFGGNPEKIKQVREMRNLWWGLCSKKENENLDLLQKMDEMKDCMEKNTSDNKKMVNEMKDLLIPHFQGIINNIQSSTTASQAMIASGATISSTKIADYVHANVICKKCNTSIGLLIGSNTCPNCGNPL